MLITTLGQWRALDDSDVAESVLACHSGYSGMHHWSAFLPLHGEAKTGKLLLETDRR
jgi:hypothetical protein